ncbi:thioredoxin domain-containing protein [Sphingomonas lenta]|uniref:Thioredoxin-like fold domain-containing protein n=1 Tax=Sphingomonas lenta TaxID=1141887 RepID=A0A2A2SD05_9SPHN|nr:thioredoxin domain-containing protein [Sphingomonas lenta]PAX07062.1 hypothetical protein CKY28_13505 [Sphingomonas lenta]
MRFAFALAGMAALTLVAPAEGSPQSKTLRGGVEAQQQRDWSRTVAATPQGGHLVGNPAAAIKIVEYASYTCPHCAHFAAESKAPLATRIRSGSTSIEYRHLIRDPLDLAAVIVARCGGAARFARINDAIFAGQQTWLGRGAEFARTNRETLATAAPGAQLRGLAEGSGLLAIGRAQGLTDVQLQRCFADKAALDRLLANKTPPEVTGTPAFFVNGRYTGAHDWTRLQPLLSSR